MAPILRSSQTGQFQWSSCSRHQMSSFLSSYQSHCLYNKAFSKSSPEEERRMVVTRSLTQIVTKRERPRENSYSADDQCAMQFGAGVRSCSITLSSICTELQCQITSHTCRSLGMPAATGTKCFKDRAVGTCRQGTCLLNSRQNDVSSQVFNEQWSQWAAMNQCPTTCGSAVRFRLRKCDSGVCTEPHTDLVPCQQKVVCRIY